MPAYLFRVRDSRSSGTSDLRTEFPDRDSAWEEMTGVCGDMVAGISRKLRENDQWQMELLDEFSKPIFRIRLVAETLD
jgi:hypothetical protein